jgi:hypothetical protein
MSTDRQLDRTISRWLEAEAPPQLPDRVLRSTFERTRATRQQVGWRAFLGRMNVNRSIPALGGVAVAVVALVFALNLTGNRPGAGGGPSPSSSPSPSPTATVSVPQASPTPEGALAEGSKLLLWDKPSVKMTMTVTGTGWNGASGDGIITKNHNADPPDGAGMIVFGGEGDYYVYADPCRWSTTRSATPSTTVDGLVAALATQASRDTSAPVDVSVDGHRGKGITLHVPDGADFSTCDSGTFGSWGLGTADLSPFRYQQGPGQIDKLWILDVDGVLVIIDTSYYAGTPKATVDELDAMAASISFN